MNYKHSSGLLFHTTRLMDNDETTSYDITVVVCWLPNCRETPMLIIDWHCGEPNIEDLKKLADAFCDSKTAKELQNLVEVQDIAE